MLNLIKIVRERSGAPLSRCKEAVVVAGDVEGALDWLKGQGAVLAEKFSSKTASHVVVSYAISGGIGVAAEIGCETDFAARSEPVLALASRLPLNLLHSSYSFPSPIHPRIRSVVVKDVFAELSAMIGEKIELKSEKRMKADFVSGYLHGGLVEGVGSRAALVGFTGIVPPDFEKFAKLVARHVVACPEIFDENAIFLSPSEKESSVKDALKCFLEQAGVPADSVSISDSIKVGL